MLCKCEYKYIWCLLANFHFEMMIANAITQCEWTLRWEKLREMINSDKFHHTDNSRLAHNTSPVVSDE